MMSKVLIELQYFGSISWYLEILRHETVMIEAHENFEKSTYRNRCYIGSPEGKLRLTIPLLHGRNQRAKYADVQLDSTVNWLKNHWLSLCSCYRKSPYFEYYEDRFAPFFNQSPSLLFDFNKQLMLFMLELLEISKEVTFSSSYIKHPVDATDFRSKILPNASYGHSSIRYHQVFEDRTGFLPDLCIVDLLFNEGPHSKDILLASVRD